jgi:hypothetical protein
MRAILALGATPCTARPEGALTRYSGNPLLRNGPETYDDLETGPRVVLRFGAGDYRMWYEAVSSSGITPRSRAGGAVGKRDRVARFRPDDFFDHFGH